MPALDITTISTVASTVAVVMGGFLWLASKIFHLGQTAHRLDSIEADMSSLKTDVPRQIQQVRNDLNQRMNNLDQRMDKLILTIAESKH